MIRNVKPGESISDALALAEPGDIVLVAPGRYRERVRVYRGGELGRAITLKAEIGSVKIDGGGVEKYGIEIGQWQGAPVAYVNIEGIEVTGCASHGVLSRPDCFALNLWGVTSHHNGGNGIYLFPSGGDKEGASGNFRIERCWTSMNGGHGTKVGGSDIRVDGLASDGNGTAGGVDGCGLQVSDQNWNFSGRDIRCSRNAKEGARICAKNGFMENFVLRRNLGAGLSVSGARLPASGFRFADGDLSRNGRGPVVFGEGVRGITFDEVVMDRRQ